MIKYGAPTEEINKTAQKDEKPKPPPKEPKQ